MPEVEFLLNFSLLCILAVIVERSDLEEALGILSQLWISGGAWRVVTKWWPVVFHSDHNGNWQKTFVGWFCHWLQFSIVQRTGYFVIPVFHLRMPSLLDVVKREKFTNIPRGRFLIYLLKYLVCEADKHHCHKAEHQTPLSALQNDWPRHVLVCTRKLARDLWKTQGEKEGCLWDCLNIEGGEKKPVLWNIPRAPMLYLFI